MKVTIVPIAAFLACLFTQTLASITFTSSLPDTVYKGHQYQLNWTSSAAYTYEIWLILERNSEGENAFTQLERLEPAITLSSNNVSIAVTIPSDVSTSGNYAIWVSGIHMITQYSGDSESVRTKWFNIANSPSSSTVGVGTGSSSPTATAVTTSSATPSASSHGSGISGGAIAGIVIGCLVLIALVIGVVLFVGWRRKRSAKQRREADARASRLAPVMPKGAGDSFEMHGRSPQMNKEFAP